MQGAELLGILREATRSKHQELDSSPRLGRLARGSVDLAFYIEMLARYRSCFVLLEALIDSAAKRMVERGETGWLCNVAPYRKRLPALETDLAYLSEESASLALGHASAFPAQPCVADHRKHKLSPCHLDFSLQEQMRNLANDSPAEFELGVRYVLDGSSMGARLIHRHLLSLLGDVVRQAWHFWQVQALVGKDWPAFRSRLQSLTHGLEIPGPNVRDVTVSANLCFRVFRDGFASKECN